MWSEKKFRELYAYWLSSGLSISSFCSNEGINENRFYYWRNKLRHSLPSSSSGEFIPISIDHPGELSSPVTVPNNPLSGIPVRGDHSFCEITYPNGTKLKLNEQPNIEVLQSLILLHR